MLVYDFDMPPAVVWDWSNDTAKRTRWMQRSNCMPAFRVKRRTGRGARNHCNGFDVREQLLDRRPFESYTVRFVHAALTAFATVSLEPPQSGTRVRWKMAIEIRLPIFARRLLGRALIRQCERLSRRFDSMAQMMRRAFD